MISYPLINDIIYIEMFIADCDYHDDTMTNFKGMIDILPQQI